MIRRRSLRSPLAVTASLAAAVCAAGAAHARDGQQPATPPRPTFDIRLKEPVSTTGSKPGDHVSAVSITGLVIGTKVVMTPGCTLIGRVTESVRPKSIKEPEVMAFEFDQIADRTGAWHKVRTQLIDVDNARETIDADGRVRGVAPIDKKPESSAEALKVAANGVQIMRALASRLIGRVPPQIDYKAGTEFVLRVMQPPPLSPQIVCGAIAPALVQSAELSRVVNAQPLRSMTPDNDRPSDVTNLVFVGTADLLKGAFDAAGWATAEAISATSSAKTFFATVAGEGYSEAPVSVQHIDGRPPDLVYQKQLNTFAKRHHVRIWQTGDTFGGQPVWIAAATHDIGIVVSKEVKLFNHAIDPNIDDERQKIVDDLSFAGAVSAHALVARPKAPREAQTTGELVHTDGKAAVIVLQKAPKK